jgi:glycosyltransferase involved in cell wall biosynthesis
MHRGLPLVTTPAGAEGLPGLDTVCDVHDDPAAFAAAVAALLDDDALWSARSAAQWSYVAERFSLDGVRRSLDAAFTAAKLRQAQATSVQAYLGPDRTKRSEVDSNGTTENGRS